MSEYGFDKADIKRPLLKYFANNSDKQEVRSYGVPSYVDAENCPGFPKFV